MALVRLAQATASGWRPSTRRSWPVSASSSTELLREAGGTGPSGPWGPPGVGLAPVRGLRNSPTSGASTRASASARVSARARRPPGERHTGATITARSRTPQLGSRDCTPRWRAGSTRPRRRGRDSGRVLPGWAWPGAGRSERGPFKELRHPCPPRETLRSALPPNFLFFKMSNLEKSCKE